MSATDPIATQPARPMTRGPTLLFAIAAGAAVGNLYAAQPLLDDIAGDLHASASNAGWLITATQVGYAVGVLLIVPLGDVRNRRHLIPLMMLCATAALSLCALGAIGFGAFTMFWTSLTFLLSAPPFSYPAATIGLFGLAGLAGALAAQRAGRLHDRGWSLQIIGAAWALALFAFAFALLARHSVVLLVIAIVILDIAIQALFILNQARAFAISREERSRINTTFVTCNFIGGDRLRRRLRALEDRWLDGRHRCRDRAQRHRPRRLGRGAPRPTRRAGADGPDLSASGPGAH